MTDRHKQIAKWLRNHCPDVNHFLIVVYCQKYKKKIQSLAKKDACQLIGSWMKSMVNHFYWSVMSTQIDNKDLVGAKWKSVLNRTQNIHDGHGPGVMVTCSQFVPIQSC